MAEITVVELLEKVLVRARAGEITGIAIATTHATLYTGSAWAIEHATLAELLGSIAILNARLLDDRQNE